jgi:hypothetical protein
VAAVHRDAGDNLVAFADLVLDLGAHRPPEAVEPAHGLLQALLALRVAGRGLVVDEVRVDQLVSRVESFPCSKSSLRIRRVICLFCSDIWLPRFS